MMQERKCVSCGAPIPYGAMRCEYCGMQYEPDYWAGTLRYVPIRTGRKRLAAEVNVPNRLLELNPDGMAQQVRHDIVHQIADGLSEMVALRMSHDWIHDVTVVRGEVWVEEPDTRTAFGGW